MSRPDPATSVAEASAGQPVSVIATLFDEGPAAERLVDSLLAQTRLPDEIVIVDGGSRDGTTELLDRLAERHPVLRVIHHRSGRSEGRNVAIAAATHEVIACIDGGCVAEPDWLEHLVAPLEADRGQRADWVAGFYRPRGTSSRATCIGLVMVYVREEVDPATFLPSARSMAMRRSLWREVGGFPEDLQFAEDTLFDQRLLDAGHTPVFAGDAVVVWTPPATFTALARTLFVWGRGDGVAGLRGPIYKRLLLLVGGTAAAGAAAVVFAPRLAPLAVAPLLGDALRRTRHKYRWADGPERFALIPAAQTVHTVAVLAGFLWGRVTRT